MVTMTTCFLALQGWEREKNACVCVCVCACVSGKADSGEGMYENKLKVSMEFRRGEQQHILIEKD